VFGYIRTDDPYLYKKDDVLYNAVYCGLCKSIGKLCGQRARFGLTYDVAFLSVMLHNLSDTDVKIEKEHCIAHTIKKRNVAIPDSISEQMAALNVVLCYYKALDDYDDTGKGNFKKAIFSKGYKRAVSKFPEIGEMAKACYTELSKHEKNKVSSTDISADPFAKLSRNVSRFVLKDKSDEYTDKLFYYLGKWIYLIDALDDYERDVASGNYNVFVCSYGEGDGKQLIEKHGDEIFATLNFVFKNLKDGLDNVKFYFNKDLIENVLLRGIPKKTDAIVKKYTSNMMEKKCQ